MATRELFHRIKDSQIIEPAAKTTTPIKSSNVDTAGFEGCYIVVNVGTWTAGTFDFKLQESDTTTDGDFTDVAAGDQLNNFAQVMSTGTDQMMQVASYLGGKRYVRLVGTGTTSQSAVFGASAHLHNARHQKAK